MMSDPRDARPGGMANCWYDDSADPGRVLMTNPHVQQLISEIEPAAQVTDLGGTMSLNVRIEPAGQVLRVHQPFVSRRRLFAVQRVRASLVSAGLIVPTPVEHRGFTVFACGDRWAELEPFIAHRRPQPTLDSYAWMFCAMGRLHTALSVLHEAVPRPLVATYAPPTSLRRWLHFTASVVGESATVRWTSDLLDLLRRQWIPSNRLPQHLVHGDVRLGNIVQSPEGETVYLDFGFLALRPRVHDLAYAIAFMVIALNGHQDPAHFTWHWVPRILDEYESTAPTRLNLHERMALVAYTAAVPLYFAALAGFTNNPAHQLQAHAPWLPLSEWVLTHPEKLLQR